MPNTQPLPDNQLSHKTSSFLLADKHVPFTDTGAKRWLQMLNNALNTVTQPAYPRSGAQYGKPQNQTPNFSAAVWYERQPLPPPVPSCAVSCPSNVSLCGRHLVPFPKVPAPPGGATSTGSQHSLTVAS